jgi:hypothetical protein
MICASSSGYGVRAAGSVPAMMRKKLAETLSRALSLWRGPPLADLTYVEAFSQDVSRLEEMR